MSRHVGSVAPDPWLSGRLHSPPRDLGAARRTAARTGCELPRTLVERIRSGQSAHVHDVLAFSKRARVGLYEAFLLFGHDLEDLPPLQAALHRDRTVILPTTAYDHERVIDWPTPLADRDDPRHGEFLSELPGSFERQPVSVTGAACAANSLYVRTGWDDTSLVPVLVPGTMVRVDTADRGPGTSGPSRSIYAVADRRGVTCTYVDWLDDRRIALVPHRHDRRPVIRRLEDEAVILGRVRAELRPMCVSAHSVGAGGMTIVSTASCDPIRSGRRSAASFARRVRRLA